jgi:hypothetical protein
MTYQPDQAGSATASRTMSFHKRVLLRVKPNGFKNALATAVMTIPPVLLLAGLGLTYFFFLNRKRIAVTELNVEGQRTLTFTRASPRQELRSGALRVGSLRWTGGDSFQVIPQAGYSAAPGRIAALPESVPSVGESGSARLCWSSKHRRNREPNRDREDRAYERSPADRPERKGRTGHRKPGGGPGGAKCREALMRRTRSITGRGRWSAIRTAVSIGARGCLS